MVNYDTLSVSSHLGACLFNLIVAFVLIFVVQFEEGLLEKYIAGAKEIPARPLSLATVEFCMAFRSRFLTLLWLKWSNRRTQDCLHYYKIALLLF